jgi:hypothetical protein
VGTICNPTVTSIKLNQTNGVLPVAGGNTPQGAEGAFIGTYNLDSGVAAYNFGTGKWQ